MSHMRIFARGLIALALVALLVTPASAKGSVYETGFTGWRAADGGFAAWQRSGVTLAADGSLQFDLQTAQAGSDPYPAGGYNGRSFYNGGSYLVGEATSPEMSTA